MAIEPATDADKSGSDTRALDKLLHKGGSRRPFFLGPLFLLSVVLPTLLAAIYFGMFASDIYVSESRFVVRSPTRPTASSLGVLLSASGFSGAGEEANAVTEYVQSRDALAEVDADGLVSTAFGPERASWFDRFGGRFGGTSREELYEYFGKRVEIGTDATLQVTSLSVRAFAPDDAKKINERLLRQSEALVNRLAERARGDAISIAQAEVNSAQARARGASLALAQFRNRAGIIDPERQAVIQLQMISKLQDELIASRTQLIQYQTYTPQASQIPFLRTRIRSLEREVRDQTSQVAGGRSSLSGATAQYQTLRLDTELSEKLMAAALTSLEEAKAEARRKRAYVERISQPSLPDHALEPRRLRGVLATLIMGLLVWGVLSTLVAGIREHRD
jgi:BexC/CtrB/KpsE family polysaccharide export inner-membrane protein